MNFYKVQLVYSNAQMVEKVFNNLAAALKVYNNAKYANFTWGGALFACNFIEGELLVSETLKKFNNHK